MAPPPSAAAPANGLATASLVLGIIGIVTCLTGLPSVLAIVFGLIGMSNARNVPGEPLLGRARTGMILGIVGLVVTAVAWSVLTLFVFAASTSVDNALDDYNREITRFNQEMEESIRQLGGSLDAMAGTALPRGDYDVAITRCGVDSVGDVTAEGTVVNRSTEDRSLVVEVRFIDNTGEILTDIGYGGYLFPGEEGTWTVVTFDKPTGDVTCEIVAVSASD
jgi:hypothetical protein